jgi:hypothetical protein
MTDTAMETNEIMHDYKDLMRANAQKYVNHIRNKEKRAYAQAYLNYLTSWRPEPKTEEYKLGTMATQAVRMTLNKMCGTNA